MPATLSDLRTRAQGRADFENDANISTATWNAWINSDYRALVRLLVRQDPDHFLSGPTEFTLTGTTDTYSVTGLANFWRLRAVDFKNGGDWQEVPRFGFRDRNRQRRAYRLIGSSIRFTPQGGAAGTYRVWWISMPAPLVADADQIDAACDMYDEMIVLRSAIRGRRRQHRDTMDLEAELQALTRDIAVSATDRDESEPDVVGDVEVREVT